MAHTSSIPIYGADGGVSEELRQYAKDLPPVAFGYVLGTHVVGPMIAAVVATWIMASRFQMGSLIIGCVFVLGGMLNLVMLPHPLWFAVIDLLLYIPVALFGGRLAERFLPPATQRSGISRANPAGDSVVRPDGVG